MFTAIYCLRTNGAPSTILFLLKTAQQEPARSRAGTFFCSQCVEHSVAPCRGWLIFLRRQNCSTSS